MPLIYSNLLEITFKFRYFKNLVNSVIDTFSQIKGLFSTFGFIDVIDIIFVALVLYLVIRVFRESRAMQLVKGLVLLVVIYFLVTFLGMGASSYILKLIFSNIIIIAFILFGPEIRNILEQMGKGATRNSLKAILHSGVAVEIATVQKSIDACCKACTEMADTKTGALIVFENETLLGDIAESGTVINAEATREIIENIFYPKAPLHDGAMIIRNGKIYAAGCILPLTNDNISSSLGTRHRAAIGISQQSDAIVFVVSEETGNISLAQNGVLTQNISSGDMRDVLIKEFVPYGSSSDDKIISKMVRKIVNNGKQN